MGALTEQTLLFFLRVAIALPLWEYTVISAVYPSLGAPGSLLSEATRGGPNGGGVWWWGGGGLWLLPLPPHPPPNKPFLTKLSLSCPADALPEFKHINKGCKRNQQRFG